MKINNLLLIFFISLIILTISTVNAEDLTAENITANFADEDILEVSDSSIYVDNLQGDDRNDGKSWDSSVKSFEKALNLSSDGGTIYLSSGNYNSENNTRINIAKSVNLIGSENTTFDGLGKDYIFIIKDNVKVGFKNINFINAYKNQNSYGKHDSEGEVINNGTFYGGALEIKDSVVTIENCSFINNVISNAKKDASGGAISNFGDLTILNSYFYGNTINSARAYNYLGGSIYNKGKLRIDNSSFISSKGKVNAKGGAIANHGTLEITNSIIANSTVNYDSQGSAIYNTGKLTLINSIIKNNAFTSNGRQIFGAVYSSGDFTGLGNIFEGNSFKLSKNQVYQYSGNIYSTGDLNLSYNAFINNMKYEDSASFSADVYTSGDVVSLNNNWWGTNENPNKAFLTNEEITSWMILTLIPEYASLNISDELTVKAVLGPNVGSANMELLPLFNVTFKTGYIIVKKELTNGEADFIFNQTHNKGSYEIIAELTGFEQSIYVDVGKLESSIEFNVTKDMTYQDVFQINVTVNGNGAVTPTGYVIMSLGNKEYVIDLVEGKGTYEIDRLNKGDYTLKLTYAGDEEYAKSFANTTLHVKRLPVNLTIYIPNFKVDQVVENGEIVLNTSDAQGSYKLYIDGELVASNRLYPGVTPIKKLGFYSVGKHNVTLEYEGSDNFEPANVSTTFEISKYSTILNVYANNTNAGDDVIITVEAIPNELRGEAELYINGVKNPIFLEDTYTNITVSNLEPGRYDVLVVYLGDTMYYGANDTTSFRVVKQSSSLEVNITQDENAYTGQIVVKTIPSQCTGLIGVYVNFKSYQLNLTDGVAVFDVEFDKGTNYIFVYYEGDYRFEGCEWNSSVGVADKFALYSDNVTAYEYNNFNYTVLLIEESGVPMMYKSVSVEVNGNVYNITTNNRGYAYLTLNLAKGTYKVNATYNGESIINTITINEILFNLTVEDISYGENEVISANFESDVEGNVHFYIEGILDNVIPIYDGIALVNLSKLNAGTYNVYAGYCNEYYNSSKISRTFKVNKVNLNFTYEFNQHDYYFTVYNLENATGNLTFKIDNDYYSSIINNSMCVLDLNSISKGNHSLIIRYYGDNNYNPKSISSYIFVKELSTDIVISINDGIYGENLTVKAVIDKNASGIVRFNADGLSHDSEVVDGVASWTFSGLNAGRHTIVGNYLGDEYYIDVSNSTSFFIGKANSTINLYVLEAFLNENIRIFANLSSNATGKVLYSMDNYYSPRFKNTVDSKSMWYISPLDTGSYVVRATFEGDDNYYESSTVFILTISQKRAILDVSIEDATIKDRVVAYFTLTNATGGSIDGSVRLQLNSRTMNVNVKNGKTSFVIGKMSAGNYSYTATYDGNEEYGKTSCEGIFEVRDTRLNVTIYAKNLTKYYNGDKKLYIMLVSSKNKVIEGAEIKVKINGKSYTAVTNEEGIASVDVNLNAGDYVALISYDGDEDYFNASGNASVSILSTVEGIDVTKLYGSTEQYYAIFSDSNGKPLANTVVKFKIGSKSYNATTFPNGIVRLNINIKAGSYNITAINPVTSQKCTNKLVINYRLMENKDVTKYYKGTKKYKVRAYGDDGNPLSGVKVKMTLNGKTYNVKTNKNGYATLSINLKPGKYVVQATYKGFKVANKITVKSTIVTKDISVKKTKTIKFQAKLLNSKGKILKSKKITFKFKGKKYTAKTNNKGIATVKIANKLKVGKYKIYSTYGSLTRTNTITIK